MTKTAITALGLIIVFLLTTVWSVEAADYDYSSTSGAPSIVDNGCGSNNFATRTFNVSETETIIDLDVGIVVDHTYRGALVVQVISPSSTVVTVINQVGTSATDLNVRLDDAAGTPIGGSAQNAVNPYPQVTRSPSNALSTFNGQMMNGTWTIRVCDNDGFGDSGTFNAGYLEFTTGVVVPTSCTGSTLPANTVTLDFSDPGVTWPNGSYGPQTYTNIESQGVQSTLSFSDTSTFNSASETNTNTGNGDTAPFFITNGFGAGSTTFTFDISANPSSFVDFCAYHINQSGGGDRLQFSAVTNLGTILTAPTFSPAPSPSYTLSGNVADAFTFTAVADGLLGVYFQAPAGELIHQVNIIWSESSGSTGGIHGLGLGQFSFEVLNADYSDAPTAGYGGADHTIVAGIQIGAGITSDSGDYNDPNAAGDVDDGVTLGTFVQSMQTNISVSVSGAGGYLQTWVDWNGDGSFATAGDQIASDVQDGGAGDGDGSANGIIVLNPIVPVSATTSQTFARFRWSTTSSLGSSGTASDGEVEDYALTISTASPSLTVAKTASASGFVTGNIQEAPAGTVVTYSYVVTNNGNVFVTSISASDVHNGFGSAPVPANETLSNDAAPSGDSSDSTADGTWDSLAPGDSITFTAAYTITQSDVDLLQ